MSIADSSGLSIQEKENITNYQQENNENTFNAPSPICQAFQNLSQISVTELMDIEIDDGHIKKGINFNLIIKLIENSSIFNAIFFYTR